MSDRIEELNQRIFSRVQSSDVPAVLFSPRPVQTKYVKLPFVNDPIAPTVQIEKYAQRVDFLPTDAKGPGVLVFVDLESTLKNMDFALQRNARASYMPGSKSDLYNEYHPRNNQNIDQPHPYLFQRVLTPNNGIPPHIKPSNAIFNQVRLRESS